MLARHLARYTPYIPKTKTLHLPKLLLPLQYHKHARSLRNMSSHSQHPSTAPQPIAPVEGAVPVTAASSDASPAPAVVKKEKAGKAKDKKGGSTGAGLADLNPPPEFFQERIKIFDEYKAKYDKWVSGRSIHFKKQNQH
jgi:hypothetical protein